MLRFCKPELAFLVVKSILIYFLFVLSLTVLWQLYKIHLARRWAKLPVMADQAILITGATSGIGLALTKHLYKLGYSIVATYYNACETGYVELKELGKKKTDSGNRLILLELDVRSVTSISLCYEELKAKLESFQLSLFAIVNNAGLGSLQPFAWLQRSALRNLVETNLTGTLLVTREFLPLLIDYARRGTDRSIKPRIINVSSGLGFVPGANYTAYGATKSAQLFITKSLNLELEQEFQVKSIAVVPHNFIKNTQICSLNARQNEEAWLELKPIERKLYRDQFDEHCKLTRSLEQAIQATQQRRKLKELTRATGNMKTALASIVQGFMSNLRGENGAITLEDSGILECFEDAIRLRDPPQVIFAGDNIFTLLVGSLLLSMPSSCASLLGPSVSPSLYR